MSLKFALLASLAAKPQTGYEIAREFDATRGYFWRATHQQIYRELNKLAADNCAEFEQITQLNKPSKKRYVITDAGRKELVKWLNDPVELQPVRDPLLVKLSAGHLANPALLKAQVEAHIGNYRQRLALFRTYEDSFRECEDSAALDQRYLYLTLRRGISVCEAWLDWAREVCDFLDAEIAKQ